MLAQWLKSLTLESFARYAGLSETPAPSVSLHVKQVMRSRISEVFYEELQIHIMLDAVSCIQEVLSKY